MGPPTADQSRSGYDTTPVTKRPPPKNRGIGFQRSLGEYSLLAVMTIGALITLIMWIPMGSG
ncbi:hypothetical protein F4804DRAFT_338293 [Jackrogersella minutella]|nr:hypothetical protein F4804DRAFT_338293 [Jackrogersella minutella]